MTKQTMTLEEKKRDLREYAAGRIPLPAWLKEQNDREREYVDNVVDREGRLTWRA